MLVHFPITLLFGGYGYFWGGLPKYENYQKEFVLVLEKQVREESQEKASWDWDS